MRTVFNSLLNLFAGSGFFEPKGTNGDRPPREAVVLAPGEIPTIDLYLRHRLKNRFGENVRYVNVLQTCPDEFAPIDNPLVVVVRHAPRRWLRWLADQQPKLAGIAFLVDDDIPSALRASELPFRYAMKTAWRYARTRRLLGQLCSEIWVSTPELASRYVRFSPRLLEPNYVESKAAGSEKSVYFYHGTWAHRREIEWLIPVVRQVQQAIPEAWFEIMGTDRVRRLYRGIPRVRVVHPMPWRDYLAYAGTVKYQVGLAPCFDTEFNRARSHSKLFDITRIGATGIYANVTPYREKVIHGRTGYLCSNEPDKWVAAITQLLSDTELRSSLYLKANDWCRESRSGSRLPI
jgi:glycosyltransferase involved in cell wall biosynthesis